MATFRFFGSNLRATHNLARNVAKAIQQAQLQQPGVPAPYRVVSFKARASSTHARRLKDETANKHVEGDMAATKIKLTLFLRRAFLAMVVVAEQVQGQTGPESQPELTTTLQPLRPE